MEVIKVGSIVTIYDFSREEEYTYKIVRSIEKDSNRDDEISIKSPLAKALIGKFAGIREVETPAGKYKLKIVRVDNTQAENSGSEQVEKLRKLINKIEREKKTEEEKKERAKLLSGWYQAHPTQGGGCSGK